MRKDSRLNIRLESKLALQVKAYARRNRTTISAIVEKHLRELLSQERQSRTVLETGEAEQI